MPASNVVACAAEESGCGALETGMDCGIETAMAAGASGDGWCSAWVTAAGTICGGTGARTAAAGLALRPPRPPPPPD